MPQFKYKAKDVSGKTVTGIQTSSSRESLVIELERKNLTVISVEKNVKEKKPDALNLFDNTLRGGARVGAFDLVIFCRQLSTMLVGGVPILRAIESIAYEAKNKKFKKVLYSIARDLREGKTLTEGIRKYPRTFSVLFISIVEAGEKVGSLDKMLRRLGNYLESRDRLARKLRSATTYPAFIAIFFCVAIGIITIFLIPRFQNMYSSFGAELPGLTLFIFKVSDFIIRNIAFMLIGFVLAVSLTVILIKRSKPVRTFIDRAFLRLPVFGDIVQKAAISKFSRTLSTLLDQGIPVTEALLLVGRTAGNLIIEDAGKKAGKLIVEGETIPKALDKTKTFPPLMLQMVSVGAESGSLPELLDKTADFYEEQVDTFVNTLMSVIEPILVVSLGAVIAIVVVALYLPIFKLGSAMSTTR